MNETELATDLATKQTTKTGVKAGRKRKEKLKNLMLRDGIWYFKKTIRGKREFNGRKTPFSLETSDVEVAKSKRDAILRAGDGAEQDRVLGRNSKPIALLTEIEKAYLAADKPLPEARAKNIACLKRVAAAGGLAWSTARVSDLTRAVVQAWQNTAVARGRARGCAEGSEELKRAQYGADRTLAQARSIFAHERPFRALHAPKPVDFLEADMLSPKLDHRYVPMSAEETALFAAECFELRARVATGDAEATGVFLTWLCMRYLGMRNNEVEACRPREWIARAGEGWVMRICNRAELRGPDKQVIAPAYLVKAAGSTRDLPVAAWLRELLIELSAGRDWLLPGATPSERENTAYRHLNEWMGAAQERAKAGGLLPLGTPGRTAYDWRKQAGSEIYAKTRDILATSKWLGHTSVQTTTRWYVGLIQALPSLA